jgi:peptidoglycan hydrolase-like protein with peptidoglycan-binding domain
MRKNRAIISGMVFSALTLSPLLGWSQSSPGTSGPSGSGVEQDQQRPRASDSSSGRSSTDSMGRSSMNGQWSQDDVRSVQEALKGKGHDPGPVDGIIGPRTQQALRAFQRAQKIQTSGQLDSSTASALGVTLSSGSSSTPGSSSRSSSGAGSLGSGTSSDPSSRDGSGTGSSSSSTKSGSSKDDSNKSDSTKSGSSSD